MAYVQTILEVLLFFAIPILFISRLVTDWWKEKRRNKRHLEIFRKTGRWPPKICTNCGTETGKYISSCEWCGGTLKYKDDENLPYFIRKNLK